MALDVGQGLRTAAGDDGARSDPAPSSIALRSELPRALGLWLGDFTLASITGFSVAFFVLHAGLIASLLVETALSATSVAVSVSVWEEQDAVHSIFISVGYGIEANALFGAIGLGLVVVAAAIVGKIAGVGRAAILQGEPRAAWLLGVRMIPRAAIAMFVAHTGRTMGSAAMSAEIYGALATMSAVTCVVGPILLRPMIKRYV